MKIDPQTALQSAKTLMLDMDGTLLDLAFDNYIWLELVPRRFAVVNDMPFGEARDILYAQFKAKQGQLDWYSLHHWAEFLKLDVLQLHHDASHRIGYLPGALEFLRQVHGQDVRVLLVTNAHPDLVKIKDARTGLADYFDELHSSHSYGHAKESQDFWSALQEEVDFDPQTTLFVDDNASVLQSARKFGIEMLLRVTRPDTTAPAQLCTEFRGVEKVADMLGSAG
jgi:HAD superfamily hydrolase (TIGR01509 family)